MRHKQKASMASSEKLPHRSSPRSTSWVAAAASRAPIRECTNKRENRTKASAERIEGIRVFRKRWRICPLF